jgi:hypothetical protein
MEHPGDTGVEYRRVVEGSGTGGKEHEKEMRWKCKM